MAAAEHGANFPKARSIRQHMSQQAMHDYASTTNAAMRAPKSAKAKLAPPPKQSPFNRAMGHPHANLGKYLHPRKPRG